MKPKLIPFALRWLAVVAAMPCLLCCVHGAESAQPAPAAAASPSTAAPPEIPKSVFAIPSSPKQGRNPFFPNATQPVALPDSGKYGTLPPSAFLLNGITSPPKRTAMINGRTFEPGESGEVRLTTGLKMLLKCEEIRDESTIISLPDGKRIELRLRPGL